VFVFVLADKQAHISRELFPFPVITMIITFIVINRVLIQVQEGGLGFISEEESKNARMEING
jgi:hypothetical protein